METDNSYSISIKIVQNRGIHQKQNNLDHEFEGGKLGN